MFIAAFAVVAAAAADASAVPALHAPSAADLVRAHTRRPGPRSSVLGSDAPGAFSGMNKVLTRGAARTLACEAFEHPELNDLARVLYAARASGLDDLYKSKADKRSLHFDSLDYKERLWAAEASAAHVQWTAPGSGAYNATRDGKCAEAVMWYIHHLSDAQRSQLAGLANFVLPLMPSKVAPQGLGGHEYALQISCTDCHVAVHVPGAPPIEPAPHRPNGSGPQNREVCPPSKNPFKPTVWYNRTKRCDWDFAPFCSPCEGVGGLVWGNRENEWNPMPCKPLMKPEEIPKDNLTSPLWPKAFTVQEYAMLNFPGTDPCSVKFRNSTYTLYYDDTTSEGPLYHTVGHTGPSGPSPFPGKSWALANGNFYNTVDIYEHSAFCICLSPKDPNTGNAITGPLRYDFLDTAILVGREQIVPEYINRPMVADHWVKGPHHFWIEVATNLMVREWQPFNGLQTYYDWNLSRPEPAVINVPEVCYKGLRRFNISCIAPPPSSSEEATTMIV